MSRRQRVDALAGLVQLRADPGPRHRGRHLARHSHRVGLGVGRGLLRVVLVVIVLAAVVFVAVQALRPAPAARAQFSDQLLRVPGGALHLPWPAQGEAAIAVAGSGLVGTAGPQTPLPMASITKVMTALVVLHDHPLSFGQQGPTITITPADVATYQHDVATQQSVVKVAAGEQLSERQALEALLIPSGNNMADVLADWAAGSIPAFVAQMNAEATALGLHHTHYVGPSGLNPGSVGTPLDLIRLGEAAMTNPVFASIVGKPSVTLPVAGTVYNYDYELDHHGIIGIKTGSDSQAGGCFLFDDQVSVDHQPVQVIGAVLGQQAPPIIQSALHAAVDLAQALRPELAQRTLFRPGQAVGTITTPWGARVPMVVAKGLKVVGWPSETVRSGFQPTRLASSLPAGATVGTLVVRLGATTTRLPVVTSRALSGPGLGWKLTDL
jgi:D-alanyl-D-alanine carboxypeptidase (penicillin-binding protein 5/6)